MSHKQVDARMASDEVSESRGGSLRYTHNDLLDMQRLGKTPQLRRSFRQVSAVSLICVLVST